MRFRYILPAALLTAGSAMAQAGAATPNAVGVWNSSTFGFTAWYIGTGFPAGSLGNKMWQSFPPELTSYFRNNSNCVRELDFRGFETTVAHFGTAFPLASPHMQVRNTIPAVIGGANRWLPGNTIYANIASIPGGVNMTGVPAGAVVRVAMIMGTAAICPTAPSGVGEALMGVHEDFQSELGDGAGLFEVSTQNEPIAGLPGVSLSGGSTSGGQNFVLPTGNIFGFGVISGEYCWTWFYEQSMVQMVTNAEIISAGGQILGGGAPPIGFAIKMNDGRDPLFPVTNDVVSYSGNSSYGNPGPIGTVWFAPFVQFSGDVMTPGITDPFPEVWSDGPMFIYCNGVQGWIDDVCVLTGGCLPGEGAILNPANSRHALWLGTDLANGLLNPTLLINGLIFADTSSGFQQAGPASKMYDSNLNAGGLLARNLTTVNGYYNQAGVFQAGQREHRTVLTGPQCGYTPVVVAPGSVTMLGFGVYNGGLGGQTFSTQSWMLDTVAGLIIDVSNSATCRLQ
ncbi:MAG: hypothetical protein HY286_14685 [Planctomycetes bacterium]|nr:hypothetical protein [Planctomycetota bacterium]